MMLAMKHNPARFSLEETRAGYEITVDVAQDRRTGAPVVFGLSIARPGAWLGDAPVKAISLREIRRLPLATLFARARAAAAFAFEAAGTPGGFDMREGPDMRELRDRVRRARAPRGTRKRKRSTGEYLEVLQLHDKLLADGVEHPTSEIARIMKLEPNAVHQVLFRARKLKEQQ